jgi:hypothetical protein
MTAELRAGLAAVLAERDAATSRLAAAAQAVRRSAELLEEAEVGLSSHDDLDDRIASLRADRIAVWVTTGGDDPRPSFELPDDLRAERAVRDEMAENLLATRAAHDRLTAARADAEAQLQAIKTRASDAALAVIFAESTALAGELEEAQRRVWEVTDRLRGLTMLWVPQSTGQPAAVRPPTEVLAALHFLERPPHAINLPPPEQQELHNWTSYRERLLADPGASFEAVPTTPIVIRMQIRPPPLDHSPLTAGEKVQLIQGRPIAREAPIGAGVSQAPEAA